ncbi:hypothetical protein [Acidovorax sp. RAC01]|uniref:hypothetical protein n=1 Tax=Acidovorax sp. RAC01 TaxID=1842533 RepID=UPI00083E70E4|nr:hypothetical protein [Acidovorax sp. RAC01]AOG24368.1 hypothetical protein BSY15_3783 [Acidovorax sp. RAC01]AOG24981.1 hypothetical protein BSY15_3860 [Acidovorax sp. RAC01]
MSSPFGSLPTAREARRKADRAQRRDLKPQRGKGHIKLPIYFRFGARDEVDLQRKPHAMLNGFRAGVAQESDWHAITLRLNWGFVLSTRLFPDSVAEARAGLDAIRAVKDRHERTGKWGVSQPEYEAVDWALAHMDGMQQMCTRRELRDALQAVYEANEYLRIVGDMELAADMAASGMAVDCAT